MQWTPMVFVLAVCPAIAGQVRVVGPAPAPYVRIQDAIGKASEGDVILVKSGTYTSIRIDSQSLSIVAENGAIVQEYTGVRIQDLKPRQTVLISGIACEGRYDALVPEIGRALWARNNLGQILAVDSSFTGFHDLTTCATFAAPAGVDVEQCAGVSFVGAVIRGAKKNFYGGIQQGSGGFGLLQGPGLRVGSNAKVSSDQLQMFGEQDGVRCGYDYAWGGAGATFDGSLAQGFFSGCALKGGDGTSVTMPCPPNPFPGNPMPGLLVAGSGSAVAILGTTCTGGHGATGDCWGMTTPPSTPNAPPTSGPVSTIAGTPRTLRGPRLVRETQQPALVFSGAAGENVELAITLDGLIHTYDATQSGVAHIPNPRWRAVGVVPPGGTLTKSFKLPQLTPQDPGCTWFCQARFTNTVSGAARLSNAWAVVEVDSAY